MSTQSKDRTGSTIRKKAQVQDEPATLSSVIDNNGPPPNIGGGPTPPPPPKPPD